MLDIQDWDDGINTLVAKLELEGELCYLKHGPKGMVKENPIAVDFLCQRFGDRESETAQQELRIPICKECSEALYNPDWILAYCINCNKSQWIYRPYAKMQHPEGNGIYWSDVCPFCSEIADKWDEKYCED